MGIATTAGQNVAKNAKDLNLADIVAQAAHTTLGAMTGPGAPVALSVPSAMYGASRDFIGGLLHPAAAPQGGVTVALPAARSAALPAATPAASAIAGSPDIEQAYQRGQTRYDTAHGQGLDATIARYVEAKGSPASLGEVAYLADIATKNTKAQPKPITPAGGAIDDARTYGAMVYYSQMAAAQNEKDAAKANEARQSAVKDHQAYVLSLAKGVNPVDTAVANGMNQPGP